MAKYEQFLDLEANAQQNDVILEVVEEESHEITFRTIQDFNQAMMEEGSSEFTSEES